MITGVKAPDFTLYDHSGGLRTLSGFLADGPVVLFFFPLASSPICTAQACHFRDLGNEFASVGAQRLGVSTDSIDKQARFAARRSFDYPLLSDVGGVMSEQFGVRRGALAKARTSFLRRREIRGGRHLRRRGLLARILPLRRTTFVIDTDRTILKIIRSELWASAHADLALSFLRESYPQPRTSRPTSHRKDDTQEPDRTTQAPEEPNPKLPDAPAARDTTEPRPEVPAQRKPVERKSAQWKAARLAAQEKANQEKAAQEKAAQEAAAQQAQAQESST